MLGMSMNDFVDRAGYNRSTVYRYYEGAIEQPNEDLDDLLDDVWKLAMHKLRRFLR